MITLRHYQSEITHAVINSISSHAGFTFTVEMARQGGKNEASACLGAGLLTAYAGRGGSAVKCAPTFRPQALISIQRLKDRLDEFGLKSAWVAESSHIVRLGKARQVFLSAARSSSVVGHTADILLEVDEAQDVSKQKYTRDFRPMGSSSNVTTVMWGTTWDDSTLLEQQKQLNLELQRKDGIRRHFSYDWQVVAACNPQYRRYAEAELARLGANHPLWLTQFALKSVPGGGRLFSRAQLAQIVGAHSRLQHRIEGKTYVAGLDLAGEAEGGSTPSLSSSPRDCTVLTIAEVDSCHPGEICHSRRPEAISGIYPAGRTPVTHPNRSEGPGGGPSLAVPLLPSPGPQIRIVEHYAFVGTPHPALYQRLVHLLKDTWDCRRIVVDATGVGEGVSSFLRAALGSRVQPFKFTSAAKSQLGFDLIAAVNSDRLKLHAPDGSFDFAEMMRQLELCRPQYRANQTLNFYVDPDEGHDDYVMALALAVHAAANAGKPRIAIGTTL